MRHDRKEVCHLQKSEDISRIRQIVSLQSENLKTVVSVVTSAKHADLGALPEANVSDVLHSVSCNNNCCTTRGSTSGENDRSVSFDRWEKGVTY